MSENIKTTWRLATVAVLSGFFVTPSFAETARTIIVMDGSGSMWGQIDGRTKLEIARETVSSVLTTIPADQELGLMAYGHREKGNCSDIELLVPPASGTGAEIADKVAKMRFLGKTPLSESVRQAAEALRYGEASATVVLVTDGLETCDADPCALGRELEASGLNFTAHVIGFGLSAEEGAQVACLAEETGGKYLQASDAGALSEALQETVVAAPLEPVPDVLPSEPLPSKTYFAGAPTMPNIGLEPTGQTTGLSDVEPAAISFPGDGTAEQCAALCDGDAACSAFRFEPPGSYFVEEARCFLFSASTEMDFREMDPSEGWVSGVKDGVLQLVRPYQVEVGERANLEAVETAPAGSRIAVSWAGPRSTYDYIRLFDAEGNWVAETAVGEENPLELQLPWLTGDFSLAYVLESEAISETRQISLTPAPVSITAPESAVAGSEVTITWVGPGAFLDNIQLLNDDTGERIGYDYTDGKDSMVWTMPNIPGNYSFAYVFRDSETIANQPISVTADRTEADSALKLVPVTFTGEGTETLELYVNWSATPAPGQALPPEAWAMPESLIGPVSAEFLPGTYDVLGDAGDTVFAGQVTVTADGPNDFTIPVSAELSPAGPDAEPVDVTISGPYMGTFRQWAAHSLGPSEAGTVISDGLINMEWQVALQPGPWLITATAEGANGPGLAALVSVSEPGNLEIAQPRFGVSALTDGSMFHRVCDGELPCSVADEFTKLRLILLPNWTMQDPYPLETAAGVTSNLPSTLFGIAGRNEPLVALNPRQWDAMLGPCVDTQAGQLCRNSDLTDDEMEGYRALEATIRVAGVEPPPAQIIEGERINLDPATAEELRNKLLGQP